VVPALDTSAGLVRSICRCVLAVWSQKERERGFEVESSLPAVGSSVELVTDELVTNAIQQAQCAGRVAGDLLTDVDRVFTGSAPRDQVVLTSGVVLVTWRLAPRVVYIEVRGAVEDTAPSDRGVSVPALVGCDDFSDVTTIDQVVDSLEERGRGLLLVRGFSRDWGWFWADDGGIAVWSVIDR
jgi:hypothetical protein